MFFFSSFYTVYIGKFLVPQHDTYTFSYKWYLTRYPIKIFKLCIIVWYTGIIFKNANNHKQCLPSKGPSSRKHLFFRLTTVTDYYNRHSAYPGPPAVSSSWPATRLPRTRSRRPGTKALQLQQWSRWT